MAGTQKIIGKLQVTETPTENNDVVRKIELNTEVGERTTADTQLQSKIDEINSAIGDISTLLTALDTGKGV